MTISVRRNSAATKPRSYSVSESIRALHQNTQCSGGKRYNPNLRKKNIDHL